MHGNVKELFSMAVSNDERHRFDEMKVRMTQLIDTESNKGAHLYYFCTVCVVKTIRNGIIKTEHV